MRGSRTPLEPPVRRSHKRENEEKRFHTWTEEELARYEAKWPIGTRERLAFDLLLYSGLRHGDALKLGRQHVRDGAFTIDTEKTKVRVIRPVIASLPGVTEHASAAGPVFRIGRRRLAWLAEDGVSLVVPIEEDEREMLFAAGPCTFATAPAVSGRPMLRIHLAYADPGTLARLLAQASFTLTEAIATSSRRSIPKCDGALSKPCEEQILDGEEHADERDRGAHKDQ